MRIVTTHSDGKVEFGDAGEHLVRIIRVRRRAGKVRITLRVGGRTYDVDIGRTTETITRRVP